MLKTLPDTLKKKLMQLSILLIHKFDLTHLLLPFKSHFRNLRDKDSNSFFFFFKLYIIVLVTSLSPTPVSGSDYVHMYMLSCFSCVQLFATLWTVAHHTPLSSCPWDSPGKSPEMGCYAHLQGIFPTQGSNLHLLCLLHWLLRWY